MWDLRLGDELDDFCVKCRRLTNHLIVSLVDGKAAKVRCRSCYADHDYRNEQAPPSKKELAKKKELFDAVLAGIAPVENNLGAPEGDAPDIETPSVMKKTAGIETAEISAPAVSAQKKKR